MKRLFLTFLFFFFLASFFQARADGYAVGEIPYEAGVSPSGGRTISVPIMTAPCRGFTGHEHLPWFGLINMNARLYDPIVGRFLSPDPYVQAPDFTQNFNRYSDALNNSLNYTDSMEGSGDNSDCCVTDSCCII